MLAVSKDKTNIIQVRSLTTVKLGDKEQFDKDQIGVKEPFPEHKCQ